MQVWGQNRRGGLLMGFRTRPVIRTTPAGLRGPRLSPPATNSGAISRALRNRSVAHPLLLCAAFPRQATQEAKRTMTPERTGTTDDVLRRVQGEFLEMPG